MSETAVNGVEPIIFLDDVHVTFRTRTGSILHPNLVHAVQGVTIKLMPGQTIGIVGESGCGKSTTANVMCGLQAPTSGKVYFKGKDVTKRTAEDRRHMGRVISVVFQNPATALNPRMVVREQLLDPMRVHNLGTEAEQEKRVKELLELTGLPSSAAEVLPGQLSGGQRQRVAIARALSLNPDAIIADEPTSALDVSVRAQILNLLTDLKKELGLAMVFISHDIQTVRYISDDIIVMNGGRIVEQQQLGVGGKRADDLQTTLGAVRQRAGLLVCQMLHIKDGQQLHGALVGSLLVLPIRRQAQHALKAGVTLLVMQADLNVILHRHGIKQANVLEGTGNTHAVDLVDRLARGVLAIEQDGAVRGLVHLGEQVEDRGLTGAVGADQTGNLGLADSQAKVVDCLKATELNAQVDALECRALA